MPGDVLASSARVTYVYNPANCPDRSLAWLSNSSVDRVAVEGASHWLSVEQPERLSELVLSSLAR